GPAQTRGTHTPQTPPPHRPSVHQRQPDQETNCRQTIGRAIAGAADEVAPDAVPMPASDPEDPAGERDAGPEMLILRCLLGDLNVEVAKLNPVEFHQEVRCPEAEGHAGLDEVGDAYKGEEDGC